MAIGNFGKDITFSVSSEKVMTFQDFKLTKGGRWAQTERIGGIPHKQFLGPDTGAITLTITLNAAHGVKPYDTQKKLWKVCTEGKPEYFVVGKRKITAQKFVITQISEAWDVIYNNGEIAKMKLDVTFETYV